MRRFFTLFAAAMAAAGAAAAQVPPGPPAAPVAPAPPAAPSPAFPPAPPNVEWRRYERASEVQIRNAAVILYVTPESRPDVAVAVAHRGGVPPIELSAHGRRVLIDGQVGRNIDCRTREGGAFQAQIGPNWRSGDELPAVYLRVPREAVISTSGAAQIHMRRAESVKLNMTGCGDADLEGVDGGADISLAGDRPRLRLYDSGAASVRIAGDGDVLLGVVRESLAVSIAGDGDFVAAHVDGPTNVAITGDGDVTIREGRAAPMSVTILGDGRVTHNGEADRLDAAIFGEGDVRVRQVNGQVNRRVFGEGNVLVGGS